MNQAQSALHGAPDIGVSAHVIREVVLAEGTHELRAERGRIVGNQGRSIGDGRKITRLDTAQMMG